MTKTIIFESTNKNPFGKISGSYITYNDMYFLNILTITEEYSQISDTYIKYTYTLTNRNNDTVAIINTERQLTVTKDEKLNNDYKLCIS